MNRRKKQATPKPAWGRVVIIALIVVIAGLGLYRLTNSKPAQPSSYTWAQQQALWNDWLADIKMAVDKGNAEDRKVFDFLLKNGTLVDVNAGPPPRYADKRFNILVLNGDPTTATPTELRIGGNPLMNAMYLDRISSLIVKKSSAVPRKVRGTTGFHEAAHAYNIKTKGMDKTDKGRAEEEVRAWEPQCRLFRRLYEPGYEPFRQKMIRMLQNDMQVRRQRASTEAERVDATFPDLTLAMQIVNNPSEAIDVFDLTASPTPDEVLAPVNIAVTDAAFAILDKQYPNREQALLMKATMLQRIMEGVSSHP